MLKNSTFFKIPRNKFIFLLLVTIFLITLYGLFSLLSYKNKKKINRVVIITIDTLRADHLSSYGYIRSTSPFLDSIAKKSFLFKNAFVPMATTAPSHASLFTSLYPIQHGVLKNGHALNDSFLTMAEIFKSMGYKTAGIASTAVHFKAGNIDQGFEYFNEPLLRESDNLYRVAQHTMDVAIKWLNTINPTDSFFLWIHLFDPHTPLQPPLSYYQKFYNQSKKNNELFNFLTNEQHISHNFFENAKAKMIPYIDAYDAEIFFVDTQIQRFYNYYHKKIFSSETLWVITADHGEGLGSHNWWLHGKHIYNEQLKVPLIFHFSTKTYTGKIIDRVVESIDIFPTIFELIGGNKKNGNIQGRSLLPLMFPKRQRSYKKMYAFGQRQHFNKENRPKIIIPERTDYEDGQKYSLQSKNYKYIFQTEGIDEFFDLQKDPYELNNIINSNSDELNNLKNNLLMKIKALSKDAPTKYKKIDKEAIKKLKDLGYVQ